MFCDVNLIQKSTKIVVFLKLLKRSEWKDFGHFLRCPLFNKREIIFYLYELLDAKFPFSNPLYETDILPVLGKKKHYRQNYVLEANEKNALSKLKSDFTVLIKRFLVFLESKEYPAYDQRLLVSQLMKRKAYDLVPKLVKNQVKKQNNSRVNSRHLLNTYLITEPLLYYDLIKSNRSKKVRLQLVLDTFWDYALSNLLRLYCAAVCREKVVNVIYTYPICLDDLELLVTSRLEEVSPLVKVYYLLLKLLRDADEEANFSKLREEVTLHQTSFQVDVLREIYNHLLNFCSRQTRKGNLHFFNEKHQIYLNGLPEKVWNTKMYLSAHHYILMVQNALEIGEYEEAYLFINTYKKDLNPIYDSVPALACAHYYFYKKEYEKTINYLLQVSVQEDFFYTLYCRVLYVKLYFEREDKVLNTSKHPLPHALDAMSIYLRRNKKMTSRIKESYLNFMRLTKRLFRIKEKMTMKKDKTYLLKRLIDDIEQVEFLVERKWLGQVAKRLELGFSSR